MRVIKAIHKPRGGIHPAYHKNLTADQPAQAIPLPPTLFVSMAQHLGAPSKPLVKKGDALTWGQLIGAAEGFVSAAVHAPAAGQVRAVEEHPGPAGRPVTTVVIETAQAETAYEAPLPPMPEWRSADKAALIERVSAAGIVGMGGAGFPTHVKLSPPPGKTIDTLLINGAECEPYLTADYRLMLEQPAAVWCGAEIIAAILGVKRVVVAIEDNKPDAIHAMEQVMRGAPDSAELAILPTHYPQGAEKQQIYAIT
ncbi:MAG: RnfABCDGE type electron transport complex subunit C, partial [Kiritimatiellia bacterium]